MLAPDAFGGFAVAVLGLNLVLALGNLHADRYAIAQAEDFEEGLRVGIFAEIIWTAALVVAGLGILPFLSTIGLAESLVLPTQILILGAFTAPFSRIRAVLERDLSFVRARVPSLVSQVIGGIAGVGLATTVSGIAPLLVWKLTSLAIESTLLWRMSPRRLVPIFDRQVLRRMARFSGPLVGAAALVYVYSHADYYVVGALLTKEDLGAYYFAFQATVFTLAFRHLLNSILLPLWSGDDNDSIVTEGFTFVAGSVTVLYMLPTSVLFAFSDELVDFVLGSEWLTVGTLLPPLMLLATLRAVGAVWEPIVMLGNVTSVLLNVTVLRVLVTPALVVLGALHFGVLGAAISMLVGYACTMPFVGIVVGRRYRLQYKRLTLLWVVYAGGLIGIGIFRWMESDTLLCLVAVGLLNVIGGGLLWVWYADRYRYFITEWQR